MATVLQKNGMKPLQNGTLSLLNIDKMDDVGKQLSEVVPPMEQCVKETKDEEPEIDIVINNVVCSFSVRCHLNLRQIALQGINVEYRREHGMVTMKLRKPYTTASIWSSGKITCTGATSEEQSRIAARRFARSLQKLGFRTRFTNFRIVNVLGTCSMPFAIKINSFSERYKTQAEYEPELHPGVTFKMVNPKATLKIFSTGSITVTAPSVSGVQQAIELIYPLVFEFRKERTKEDETLLAQKKLQGQKRKMAHVEHEDSFEEEVSDESWD
uniref:TATA box-binding protein-like 1 n=1 Tax=Clastoptera arizonana TaxID=38151 RepID=A0A1B6DYM7_9HEMI